MAFRVTFLLLLHAAGIPALLAVPGSLSEVSHTPKQPHSGEAVTIRAKYEGAVQSATVQYQVVEPGKYIALTEPEYASRWETVPMTNRAEAEPKAAGVRTLTGELPGTLQKNRRLIRYRIRVTDAKGKATAFPVGQEAEPNFAYFVYDGIPAWRGAIEPRSRDAKRSEVVTFPAGVMGSIQAYHLISKGQWVENATWREQPRGKEYKYTGTLVFNGEVYDHVRFRARGGDWRYAMGKNMWKIAFNDNHRLAALDNYGQPYRVPWGKLNLRACIQQGDYGHRGEQGMFEAVGFQLFNLAGVPAPRTHWAQLRMVTGESETPANQYQGDFWGLYLAIENEDGRFLKEHELPDGNIYKMMYGQGLLSHQGKDASTNAADLRTFMMGFQRSRSSEGWWQQNVDLPSYYSYRSIVEAIHHYDIGSGKNYDYYLNPVTHQWSVVPWDIDLTWSDNMYGDGEDPFKRLVLSRPAFRIAYQNRLREIRDLLFNAEQTGALIDEMAAVISNPGQAQAIVDADRAKWDYHPAMASAVSMRGKADQGLFYQASPTGTFAGMVQLMKLYVKRRSAYIDSMFLRDSAIPATPKITSLSPASFPVNQLKFGCSEFEGKGAFAGMEWRAGVVSRFVHTAKEQRPGRYEITPAWVSGELPAFKKEIGLPANALHPGETCRVRVRMKDAAGNWSHWSEPVQFVVGKAAP